MFVADFYILLLCQALPAQRQAPGPQPQRFFALYLPGQGIGLIDQRLGALVGFLHRRDYAALCVGFNGNEVVVRQHRADQHVPLGHGLADLLLQKALLHIGFQHDAVRRGHQVDRVVGFDHRFFTGGGRLHHQAPLAKIQRDPSQLLRLAQQLFFAQADLFLG